MLDGSIVGEPYRTVGRGVAVANVRSAGMTYSLTRLPAAGPGASPYRAIRIPGASGGRASPVDAIKSEFYLIRDGADNSLYLIRGSSRALLVGTGAGAPGLARFVDRLAGKLPVEVIVTSDDPGQVGGLRQFSRRKVYVPRGSAVPRTGLDHVAEVRGGDSISLGADGAGRPLAIQVLPLAGHSSSGLTLLDVNDRVLLSGDALGTQAADEGLILHGRLADFAAALAAWRADTDGKYDVIYTAHNPEWFILPAFVDQLQSAVNRGMTAGDAAFTRSRTFPGRKMLVSGGPPDVVASVVLAD